MSETLRKYGAKYNTTFCSLCGLSTDTKPTGSFNGVGIANGSEFIEMDTNKKYLYDEEHQQWNLASSGGGGGGGSATGTPILVSPSAVANEVNEAKRVMTLKGGTYVRLPSGEGRSTPEGMQYYVFTTPINKFTFVNPSNVGGNAIVIFTCGENMQIQYAKGSTYYSVLDKDGNSVTDSMTKGKTYRLSCYLDVIQGNIEEVIASGVKEFDEPIVYKVQ